MAGNAWQQEHEARSSPEVESSHFTCTQEAERKKGEQTGSGVRL